MNDIKNVMKHKATRVFQYAVSFLKWIFIAFITGAVGGGIGALFRYAIEMASELRTENPWLCFLLPAGGVFIVFLYHITNLSNHADTNLILNSVRTDAKVPILLAPVIFISTVVTHLFGGSAGREGAALQLGGSIGSFIGRVFRLNEKDMHIAVMCGMSGLFCSLFSTPLTATIFAMEVISVGIIYYSAFIPCIVSSLTAFWVTRLLGLSPIAFELIAAPKLGFLSVVQVAGLGIGCALVSILFCLSLKWSHTLSAKYIKNDYLRIVIGGAAIALLSLVLGTRYNGTGSSVIAAAIETGDAFWYDFLLKILFTAITIGFGYKGGEIIPTFFIGATFGAVFGSLLGLDPAFSAAVGLVSLFCAVVNCPIASLVLSVELFGESGVVLFTVSVCVSFMLSGYYGLYTGQKIMYSKRRARFINRNAK